MAWTYPRPQHEPKSQSQAKWLARLDSSHWLLEVGVGLIMLSYALTVAAAAETLKANVGSLDASLAGLVFGGPRL